MDVTVSSSGFSVVELNVAMLVAAILFVLAFSIVGFGAKKLEEWDDATRIERSLQNFITQLRSDLATTASVESQLASLLLAGTARTEYDFTGSRISRNGVMVQSLFVDSLRIEQVDGSPSTVFCYHLTLRDTDQTRDSLKGCVESLVIPEWR